MALPGFCFSGPRRRGRVFAMAPWAHGRMCLSRRAASRKVARLLQVFRQPPFKSLIGLDV
ncbi:hypothetical protein CDN98_09995 [Roseateles terrae]|nr:hypothetical protein CDN98_09995 [Roseateles terrae]